MTANRPRHSMDSQRSIWRILDANLNRVSEGLRAVEDYLRFVADDRDLSERCKHLRHESANAVTDLIGSRQLGILWRSRDSHGDVGRNVAVPSELRRDSESHVLQANLKRVTQGLRSLEEWGKTQSPAAAARIEQLRYQAYQFEAAVLLKYHAAHPPSESWPEPQIYVLVDGSQNEPEFRRRLAQLNAAGPDLIQLRDKQLNDIELLERAEILRRELDGSATRLIVNDRPDIAAAAQADGVHLGQEDLSVAAARAILGPSASIGRSTHSPEQVKLATAEGADYLGLGPTFPSSTKRFDEFPGVHFLREVSPNLQLPAFAIGGIALDNVADVVDAGIGRVAVSSCVWRADDPGAACRQLRARLTAAWQARRSCQEVGSE